MATTCARKLRLYPATDTSKPCELPEHPETDNRQPSPNTGRLRDYPETEYAQAGGSARHLPAADDEIVRSLWRHKAAKAAPAQRTGANKMNVNSSGAVDNNNAYNGNGAVADCENERIK